MGYVYTDLGVLYRQRASSDLDKAKSFYEGIKTGSDFYAIRSYLVELYIKKNDKNAANTQFEVALKAAANRILT